MANWIAENLGIDRTREIDRIRNNGPYAPGNLRWSTRWENACGTNKPRRTAALHAFRIRYPEVRYSDRYLLDLLREMTPEDVVARFRSAPRALSAAATGSQSQMLSSRAAHRKCRDSCRARRARSPSAPVLAFLAAQVRRHDQSDVSRLNSVDGAQHRGGHAGQDATRDALRVISLPNDNIFLASVHLRFRPLLFVIGEAA